MQMTELGRTGIQVSRCCLGTMTWGEQNTEAEGHEQMDYALDRGINFFDTAEMYAVPPKPETQGATESIIGTWFAERKNRDKVILATKVAGRAPMNWLRDFSDTTALDAKNIEYAVERSLKRLQTDYIDLYQMHWPDRPIALFGAVPNTYKDLGGEIVPIDETLRAMENLVKSGKVRHIGLSNETPWGTMKFLHHSETKDLPRVQSVQNAYNLLNRSDEMGLAEVYLREQVGLLAYSPLAQGYLSGKYQRGALPEGSRKALFNRLQRYEGDAVEGVIDQYIALAREHDTTVSKLAIKFCDSKSFVDSTIIGATTMDQLKEDIDAFDLEWTEELDTAVNKIHVSNPNPAN